ncbi:MAG TPA: CDP-alcohol phosphatidyltransferase family protein [Gammaproteobacteria bacterium]|nr:CDP-alcohol phosphatidyltransferase family protein [Gammaproteobacteria bacterium]
MNWTKQIPNALTTLRLVLTVPICILILEKDFSIVLWIAAIAGFTDWLDGWLARRLDAMSRYGAVIDPVCDKVMLIGIFVSVWMVGLVPWWLAFIVVVRDFIIVSGALVYHWLYGRYEMDPSIWGKLSTFVQIVAVLVILGQQVYPVLPEQALQAGWLIVVIMAFISAGHYVYVWGGKAIQNKSV